MMHLSCGLLMAFGFVRVWRHSWLRIAGTIGLLSLAITYHALYNLLIAAGGVAHLVAIIMPLATLLIMLSAQRLGGMLKAS